MDPGRSPGRVRPDPAPLMTRRQSGAPGPPPRRPRRRLARPAVQGSVGQRGPAPAVGGEFVGIRHRSIFGSREPGVPREVVAMA